MSTITKGILNPSKSPKTREKISRVLKNPHRYPLEIPLLSPNQTWLAGKSPMNGGIHRKINDFYRPFSIAMLDYRRIVKYSDVQYRRD